MTNIRIAPDSVDEIVRTSKDAAGRGLRHVEEARALRSKARWAGASYDVQGLIAEAERSIADVCSGLNQQAAELDTRMFWARIADKLIELPLAAQQILLGALSRFFSANSRSAQPAALPRDNDRGGATTLSTRVRGFVERQRNQYIDLDGVHGNQCMDLMHQYVADVFGLPRSVLQARTAYDAYVAGDPDFEKIDYAQGLVPQPGDIVFWERSKSNFNAGHVAVFISGDAKSFMSFDQNFPEDSPAHEQSHPNYVGVAGWLRFAPAEADPEPTRASGSTVRRDGR